MNSFQNAVGGIKAPNLKKKKKFNLEEAQCILFAGIPLLGFMIFGLVPLAIAIIMSFMEIPNFSITEGTFIGAQNYVTVWNDKDFWGAVVNTLILGSSTLISQVLSLGVAYLLSQEISGKKTFRIIYFIPYVCSIVAVAIMWRNMFNSYYGIINHMLGKTGAQGIKWFDESKYYSGVVIFVSVWSGMGYGIIMYTAALTGVNRSLVEASKIDGANPLRVFWNIVLPAISPTSFFLLVTGVIGALQCFTMPQMLSALASTMF